MIPSELHSHSELHLPILDIQPRHSIEVAPILRGQFGAVVHAQGSNAQIVRRNADLLRSLFSK
jgi:hypothetical protein